MYTYIYIIYIYAYIYVCVCVCKCIYINTRNQIFFNCIKSKRFSSIKYKVKANFGNVCLEDI